MLSVRFVLCIRRFVLVLVIPWNTKTNIRVIVDRAKMRSPTTFSFFIVYRRALTICDNQNETKIDDDFDTVVLSSVVGQFKG